VPLASSNNPHEKGIAYVQYKESGFSVRRRSNPHKFCNYRIREYLQDYERRSKRNITQQKIKTIRRWERRSASVDIPSADPAATSDHTVHLTRTFLVSAGAKTFYINGSILSGQNTYDQFWLANMKAVFYPE
jgi:hypothetical protein